MATLTAIRRESAGSNTLIRAQFTDMTDGSGWQSKIQSIVAFWCNPTDDPTQTDEAIDVSLSGSDFTFHVGAGSRSLDLMVLAKI